MYKPQGTDWHSLDPEEQGKVDQACNGGAHSRLTQDKGLEEVLEIISVPSVGYLSQVLSGDLRVSYNKVL